MIDYSRKLADIAIKKQRLLEEEVKLIDRRKKEIAASAERLGLLTASDELITGLFLEALSALKENPDRITAWESEGAQFLKSKKQFTETTQTNSDSIDTIEPPREANEKSRKKARDTA